MFVCSYYNIYSIRCRAPKAFICCSQKIEGKKMHCECDCEIKHSLARSRCTVIHIVWVFQRGFLLRPIQSAPRSAAVAMASPHASSFICLPNADKDEVTLAYAVYYGTCLGSAVVGAVGALILLGQVCCGATRRAVSKSQRNILANLAIADLLADLGEL